MIKRHTAKDGTISWQVRSRVTGTNKYVGTYATERSAREALESHEEPHMSKPVKLPSGAWRIRFLDSNGTRKSETYKTLDAAEAALLRRTVENDPSRYIKRKEDLARLAVGLAKEIRRLSTDAAELGLADDLLVFAGLDPHGEVPWEGEVRR